MERSVTELLGEKVNPAKFSKPVLVGVITLIIMVAVVAGRSLIETATAKDYPIESAAPAEEVESESGHEEGTRIFVHVTGSVARPGLVELPEGARVDDAVTGAGGFTEEARQDSVNLARTVQDGEQITVLSRDQAVGMNSMQGEGQEPSAVQGANSGKVNINTATAGELQGLPGIGPGIADKIVADRTAHGPYESVEDLKRVSGIGDKKYGQISELICI